MASPCVSARLRPAGLRVRVPDWPLSEGATDRGVGRPAATCATGTNSRSVPRGNSGGQISHTRNGCASACEFWHWSRRPTSQAALKPYKGGNDQLWALYRLNNIEKHRLLLTVGSQAASINLYQLMASHFSCTFPGEAVALFESMNVFLNPADKGVPLKAG
jgi:hypothetical protein